MTFENRDPTTSIVKGTYEETNAIQVKTIDTTEIKHTKSNDSSINSLSSNEYRLPSSLNALSRRPSSLNLGKSVACNAVLDVSSSPVLSEPSSINNYQSTSPPSYSIDNAVLIIIMPNSTIDIDTTIQNIEKQGFKIIDQHLLQLSSPQVDILYAYDDSTKLHYKQLFDGWKQVSLSDKVQVVLIEKEKVLQEFQSFLTTQNSTKKKNRVIDPLSIYASISQENTKRDIELLLKPIWDTRVSNNSGETVSSASSVPPSGTNENHDTVIHYASKEKLEKIVTTVMDGKPNIENNNENKQLDLNNKNENEKEKLSAIKSLKSTAKLSITQLNTSVNKKDHQQLQQQNQPQQNIILPIKDEENTKNDITIMKHDLNKGCETKQEQSSVMSIPIEKNLIKDDDDDNNKKGTINNNKDGFDSSETSIASNNNSTTDVIKDDTDTTKKSIDSINTVIDTSKETIDITTVTTETIFTEENKESVDRNKITNDTIKTIIDTEKEVADTTITTNNIIPGLDKKNDDTNNLSPIIQNDVKGSNDDNKIKNKNTFKNVEKKKIENKISMNPPTKTKADIQKTKAPNDNKMANKKVETNSNKSSLKYGSIKRKPSAAIQKEIVANNDKVDKLNTTSKIALKVKDNNKTISNETTDKPKNNNRISRVAPLTNDKIKKGRTTTATGLPTTSTVEPVPHENTDQNKSMTKPKKVITPSVIARLTAPTESSARRQQTIVHGKAITPITTTTSTSKPSSTTAFIRLEGRKRVSSAVSKKELPNLKPPSSSLILKKTEKNKKEETKQSSKKISTEITLLENKTKKEQSLEIQTSQDNLNPTVTVSTNKVAQENIMIDNNNSNTNSNNNNNNDDDDENSKGDNKSISKTAPLSPQSPESSTTSSRPRTPQQEEGSTGVTLDTVNVKMKQGNSRVKDLLQRFT